MDPRQVVRYSGSSRDGVRARVRDDLAPAAAAGFQPLRWAHWDARRRRPCLVVEYRWSPPATVERRRFAGELEVSEVLVDDTAAMAHCGYVQVEHVYVRAAGGSGDLVLRYRYDPAVAGEPIGPLPTAHGDPRGVWWVLWPDTAGPVVDGEAGTLEHVVRTAVTRGLSAVRRSRPVRTSASGEP